MKKITRFYIVILFLISSIFIVPSTYAEDSTPSADIKSKLDALKREIASKAAKLKQEVSNKLRDKAYVGTVKTVSEKTITLATKDGPKMVNVNQDTLYESEVKGEKYSQKLVAEEDYIASLGDVDETGVLTARKVILLPPPSEDEENLDDKTFLWGQVSAISDKLVTIKDRNNKSLSVSFDNPSSVKLADYVIITGVWLKNEIFEAEYAYVIPQGATLKPRKVATPSASVTQTSSPSASPRKTSTPSPKSTSR